MFGDLRRDWLLMRSAGLRLLRSRFAQGLEAISPAAEWAAPSVQDFGPVNAS
jgi:hypothetical protein